MNARIMLGLLLVFQLADAATFVLGTALHGIVGLLGLTTNVTSMVLLS